MIRLIGFALLAAVVGLAAYVYDVKYQTGRLNRQAQTLQRDIDRERDQIATLRAEWSALNQPARLQALGERHLPHLRRFQVAQIGFAHELPERPLDLGIFLESLASRDPSLSPDAGSPRGATRTPLAAPVPLPRPQTPRR
jgi:cell division protein FtsL